QRAQPHDRRRARSAMVALLSRSRARVARGTARRAKSRSQDGGGARRAGGRERAIVASQDLPHVETQSKDYSERISKYGTASLAVPSGAPLIFSFLQQGLNASWELDLFGKVRRAVEAQEANT